VILFGLILLFITLPHPFLGDVEGKGRPVEYLSWD